MTDKSSQKTDSNSTTSNSTKESERSAAPKSTNPVAKIITIEDNSTPLYKPVDKAKAKKPIADVEPVQKGGSGLNKYIADNKNFDVDKYFQDKAVSLKDVEDDFHFEPKDKKMGPKIDSKGHLDNKSNPQLKKYKSMAADQKIGEEDDDEFRPISFGKANSNSKERPSKLNIYDNLLLTAINLRDWKTR